MSIINVKKPISEQFNEEKTRYFRKADVQSFYKISRDEQVKNILIDYFGNNCIAIQLYSPENAFE